MQKPRSLKGLFVVAATALVLGCYSARRFDGDRRANSLRFSDSGGSNFCAE